MKAMNAPVSGGGHEEREDGDHLTNYDCVRAWASERGLRRWAVWGTHGVQRVWQSLHQRKQMPENSLEAAQAYWKAIQEKNFTPL